MRVGDLLSAATECRVLVTCSLTLVVFGELVGSGSREAFFLLLHSWKDQCPHSWPSFVGRRPSQEWESKFQPWGASRGLGRLAFAWGAGPGRVLGRLLTPWRLKGIVPFFLFCKFGDFKNRYVFL